MTNLDKRWALAQEYELNWWKSRQAQVDFDFYKIYCDDLRSTVKSYLTIDANTKILEIGSGAGGILTFLKESNERYAIDPLEKFYSSVEQFSRQRDLNIKYFSAKGEEIPFEDKMFDLIIMDNVLDHCEFPEQVLREVERVIKDNGLVFFKQNTYHFWGKLIRNFMEKFLIDKGHPHTFSKKNLINLIKKNNFRILKYSRSGYLPTWLRELKSNNIKDKIKAFLFVTRDKITYLLIKN